VLQDLVGVMLLQTSPRGSRLSEGGEAMLRRVKLAMAEARALDGEVGAWRGEIRGRVVVGALPLSVPQVLPQAVDALMQHHPDVAMTVVDGTYDALIRQLRNADIDVILGALRPGAPPEVKQEILFEEELVVISRPDHPCLRRGDLTLADLHEWKWVVPLPGTPAATALEQAFALHGLNPPGEALQATGALFTRALVARTDFLALASSGQALEDERAGLLRVVPVGLPGMARAIGFAVRNVGDPSPDVAALLQELRSSASRLNGS
jgi:DNA-binding transcriptional LysR family regulator